MPVLWVTFTIREIQRVAGVCSDNIVINRSPTHSNIGAGSAPPPAMMVAIVGVAGLASVAVGEQQDKNARLLLRKVVG